MILLEFIMMFIRIMSAQTVKTKIVVLKSSQYFPNVAETVPPLNDSRQCVQMSMG